jgi:hypothetical protein
MLPLPRARIREETVPEVAQRLPGQHGVPRGVFRIDLSERSKVRELGDVGRGPSTVGTPAVNPGAVVVESGFAWAGARRGGAKAALPPLCAICPARR